MSEISLTLQGLNCPNCAGKIEKNVSRLKNVDDASLNLMNQEIFIQYSDISKNEIIEEVTKITVALEPHVKVLEKSKPALKTKKPVAANAHEGCCNGAHPHEEGPCSGESHGEHSHRDVGIGTETATENDKEGFFFSRLDKELKMRLVRYAFGLTFYAGAIAGLPFEGYTILFFIAAYVLFGGDVILKAVRNIARGEIFDENFLMSISTIGAFAIGDFAEAVAVMLFYQAGEFFQDMAVDRSRKSIKGLMNLKADYANLVVNGQTMQVDPVEVAIGDIIIVKPGEKIPLDGIVIEGKSQIDASSLIGESVPRSAEKGDVIMSGAMNLNGILTVEVTKDYSNSTVAKIMDMVENASNKKAPTERFITRFSKVYTPLVVLAAVLLAVIPPLLIEGALFSDWLYRGLVFLVVSCPCALVISVPLGFFSGIGFASKKGILVKGSVHLQSLSEVDTIVFDKTGTLTKGVFKVTAINSASGIEEEELLKAAGEIEGMSNHPIAKSIMDALDKRGILVSQTDAPKLTDFEEIGGKGLKAMVNGVALLAGNYKLMMDHQIQYMEYDGSGTVVHVARGGDYLGYIVISDVIKEDSKSAIERLKSLGIVKTVMLTGDREETAQKIGAEIGLDEIHAQLLPNEKVEALESIYKNNPDSKIAFAGDGINDAPVLARADVGIAMGGVGSDAAIEAADIVIMTDEPSKIADAILTANKTMTIVKQNIVFALGVKAIVLILSVVGFASMWLAVFADVGVALLAVLNAMRAK